jgi:hypothetical protein
MLGLDSASTNGAPERRERDTLRHFGDVMATGAACWAAAAGARLERRLVAPVGMAASFCGAKVLRRRCGRGGAASSGA